MKTTYKELKPLTKERLTSAIDRAVSFAKENNFQISKEDFDFEKYKEAVSKYFETEISFSMKKKINRRVSRMEYKLSRRKINLFFHYLNKRMNLNMPVKFNPSLPEQEVIKFRKAHKEQKAKLNEIIAKFKKESNYDLNKLLYIEFKKQYYGANKMSTEYTEK